MKSIIVLCEEFLQEEFGRLTIPNHRIYCFPPPASGKTAPDPEYGGDMLLVQITAASPVQDLLSRLSPAERSPVLLFERRENRIYYVASANFSAEVLAALETLWGSALQQMSYPEDKWGERFPSLALTSYEREIRKTVLYGATRRSFETNRAAYMPALQNNGYYMFVWELAKCELEDYAVNKDLHYYLHGKRLEEFSAILAAHSGGEILFSDISFAYILLNAPDSRSAAARTHTLQRMVAELVAAGGKQNAFCFLSDFIPDITKVPEAYAAFGKACASRFFCREAKLLSPTYIHSHRRWIDSDLIASTMAQVKHLIRVDIAGQTLVDCVRKLYLEIIKPSMSYMLYYVITEALLICLEQEQAAKSALDTFNDPHLLLQTPYLSVEESCDRVLTCIAELGNPAAGRYAIQSDLVKEAVAYMEAHAAEELRIAVMARKINVNPAYLGQRFKAETGYSIKDYAARLRIQMAKMRLLRSNSSIAVIASDLGFSDYSSFSKMFKKHMGVSPTRYRYIHGNDSPVGGVESHFSPEIQW